MACGMRIMLNFNGDCLDVSAWRAQPCSTLEHGKRRRRLLYLARATSCCAYAAGSPESDRRLGQYKLQTTVFPHLSDQKVGPGRRRFHRVPDSPRAPATAASQEVVLAGPYVCVPTPLSEACVARLETVDL